MRRNSCGNFGVGALISTFLLGLLLAVVLPTAAMVLLGAAVLLAALLFVQQLRC